MFADVLRINGSTKKTVMKKKMTILMLTLTIGAFAANNNTGHLSHEIDPLPLPIVPSESIKEVSRKEVKSFVKKHKTELRKRAKEIKSSYRKKELKALKKEEDLKQVPGISSSKPDHDNEKSSKEKLYILLMIFIPLAIVTTLGMIFLFFLTIEIVAEAILALLLFGVY